MYNYTIWFFEGPGCKRCLDVKRRIKNSDIEADIKWMSASKHRKDLVELGFKSLPSILVQETVQGDDWKNNPTEAKFEGDCWGELKAKIEELRS